MKMRSFSCVVQLLKQQTNHTINITKRRNQRNCKSKLNTTVPRINNLNDDICIKNNLGIYQISCPLIFVCCLFLHFGSEQVNISLGSVYNIQDKYRHELEPEDNRHKSGSQLYLYHSPSASPSSSSRGPLQRMVSMTECIDAQFGGMEDLQEHLET